MFTVHTSSMKRPIIPYNPALKKKARQLRNNSTLSEVKLWAYLKGKQMHGVDFHRQRPVDQFIVDFFCNDLYLVIELDGYTHRLERTAAKDQKKESRLQQLGIRILRFEDEEIYHDIDNVLRAIETIILEQKEKRGF